MTVLIIGLAVFFAGHSVRIFADDWRNAQIARLGPKGWRGAYALTALIGFVLIVWGFGLARTEPAMLWIPPAWGRHAVSLLTLPAFILMVAGYVPGNHLKTWLGHPMVAGVALWALAHLLTTGRLDTAVLFGAFLAWATLDYFSAVRRDRLAGVKYPAPTLARDVLVVAIGAVGWAVFAAVLHQRLIGRAIIPG